MGIQRVGHDLAAEQQQQYLLLFLEGLHLQQTDSMTLEEIVNIIFAKNTYSQKIWKVEFDCIQYHLRHIEFHRNVCKAVKSVMLKRRRCKVHFTLHWTNHAWSHNMFRVAGALLKTFTQFIQCYNNSERCWRDSKSCHKRRYWRKGENLARRPEDQGN